MDINNKKPANWFCQAKRRATTFQSRQTFRSNSGVSLLVILRQSVTELQARLCRLHLFYALLCSTHFGTNERHQWTQVITLDQIAMQAFCLKIDKFWGVMTLQKPKFLGSVGAIENKEAHQLVGQCEARRHSSQRLSCIISLVPKTFMHPVDCDNNYDTMHHNETRV